jgi:hypothetical protein
LFRLEAPEEETLTSEVTQEEVSGERDNQLINLNGFI